MTRPRTEAEVDRVLAILTDLHRQATMDRSHHYVGKCVVEAITLIEFLRLQLRLKEEGL